MKVTLAESLGMCFGVRDAVAMALESPYRSDLTILGELVHNPVVLRELEAAGIRMADSVDAAPSTGHVMITAHGAADSALARTRSRGYQVLDATCPLVRHAHRSLAKLVAQGYFPVVIGRRDHVEVRGLVGDFDECAVILNATDFFQLEGRARLGIVAQTTQPLDEVKQLVCQIRDRFPAAEVRFIDTVCQPTKERQEAARRLARQVNLMVVIGGRGSNNTRQLALTCAAQGAPTYQVENADDLCPEWFVGVGHVGVTAGTSTPESTIQEVVAAIHQLAGCREPATAGVGR
jgi:4-hydroxy-3-methylbut-2-enyl diphosphate reductase